jgi:C4-dicarboxylate-specific signal transduction histidine kinase
MQDFGGDLRVANHPDGGAVFSVVMHAVEAREKATN